MIPSKTDGFANPYDDGLITSEEACARLGVERATLYSYASRGAVRRVQTGGRRRLYVAADVDRLAARSAARKGHAAVAVGALRWGEPVLDSAITSVVGGSLRYRGRDVVTLVEGGARFESVAERLWEAEAVDPWPAPARVPRVAPSTPLVWRMVAAIPALALADPSRHGAGDALEHGRARRLVATLAHLLGTRRTSARDSIAERVSVSLTGKKCHRRLVDAALILCADHELNVSTFTARVAASSGADLYACVGGALYTFTGPKHGTASARVRAILDECERDGVTRAVRARLARGEAVPGFGHPLYPEGDPRTAPLLALASEGRSGARALRTLLSLVRVVEGETGERPNVDLGIVAIALAMGAPEGAGSALFGLGRTTGWIAHVLEQRRSPELLRPRARYVGP